MQPGLVSDTTDTFWAVASFFFFSSILCLSFKHLIIQEMHSFIRNIFYRKSYISCKKYLRKEKSTLNYDMLIHGTTITKRITLVPANFLNLTAQYSSLHFSQTLTLFFHHLKLFLWVLFPHILLFNYLINFAIIWYTNWMEEMGF